MLVIEAILTSQKAGYSEGFNLRMQRSLSWFKRALQLGDDLDLKFISLWVAFQAIYARENTSPESSFQQFLTQMIQHDDPHRIDYMLWGKFPQTIQVLLDNPYTCQSYWDYQHHHISQLAWKEAFSTEQQQLHHAWQHKDSLQILSKVFQRLQTLGQQMMRGGTRYKSAINRQWLDDACLIFSSLLSAFMFVLLENEQMLDGQRPFYPVVQFS